jgi:hypothetical protein
MICPICEQEGKKSKVYGGHGMRTLMYCQPWYDEEGKYHDHDSNVSTTEWRCSNNHQWTERISGECWCGWGKDRKRNWTRIEDYKPPELIRADFKGISFTSANVLRVE